MLFVCSSANNRYLHVLIHSFTTRRSSDLSAQTRASEAQAVQQSTLAKARGEAQAVVPKAPAKVADENAGRLAVQNGRAHVCTQVTNAHLVCRLLLDKRKRPLEALLRQCESFSCR